jgi:hypothetical protein
MFRLHQIIDSFILLSVAMNYGAQLSAAEWHTLTSCDVIKIFTGADGR